MEEIRMMRLNGLMETAEYYLWVSVDNPNKKWTAAQKNKYRTQLIH